MGSLHCRANTNIDSTQNIHHNISDLSTEVKNFFIDHRANTIHKTKHETMKGMRHSFLHSEIDSNSIVELSQNIASICHMRDLYQVTQENAYSALLYISLFDEPTNSSISHSPNFTLSQIQYASSINDMIYDIFNFNSNELLNEKPNKYQTTTRFSARELTTYSSFLQTFDLNEITQNLDQKSKTQNIKKLSRANSCNKISNKKFEKLLKGPLNKIKEYVALEKEGSELEKIEKCLKTEILKTVTTETKEKENEKEKINENPQKRGRHTPDINDSPQVLRQKRISYSLSLRRKQIKKLKSIPRRITACRASLKEKQGEVTTEKRKVLEKGDNMEVNAADRINTKHGQSLIHYLRENLSPNRKEVRAKHGKNNKKERMKSDYTISIREIVHETTKLQIPDKKQKRNNNSEIPISLNALKVNCNCVDNFLENVDRYLEVDHMGHSNKKKSHMKCLSTYTGSNPYEGYSRQTTLKKVSLNEINPTKITIPAIKCGDIPKTEKLTYDNPKGLMTYNNVFNMSCTYLSQSDSTTIKAQNISNMEDEKVTAQKVPVLMRHFTFK